MASTSPVLKKMSPQLRVADLAAAIEFYTQKLGFTLDFRYEDFYAGIMRDGHSIHLKWVDCPENEKDSDDLDIFFAVDNIEALYEVVQNKSVHILQPLREAPYGREFYIADPDGHHIGFVEES